MNKARSVILVIVVLSLIALFYLDRTYGILVIINKIFPAKKETALIKFFPFDNNDSLKEWSEKVLKGHVKYTIESFEGSSYVHAVSKGSCSAMYYEVKLDAARHPFLSWKWRVTGFPGGTSKDDLSDKAKDDFAARVYIIFPALFFANSKVLEYVWAKDLPAGTIGRSPYSNNIKIVVLKQGEAAEWASEERDIYKDYLEAFSEKPKLIIGALAFMCDSDSTKTEAEAFFDDIKIFYKR
ncbi:MAG: DUF3047 domain-containing protein [Candidatus Omnitrophica bacterium]|nr:DUF3047 domain-containing protein [Candidatus Omnitrophota bacterium]MBU4488615.1 DUF3047 domain-containing protein [Candidatus Omnitrophota bacterium]MCG2705906.1 DUF3047 domain-containing protein [Candidatus Omnitrophota bacterium]